jgi:ABC-type anion transport system duplicated permease subunit
MRRDETVALSTLLASSEHPNRYVLQLEMLGRIYTTAFPTTSGHHAEQSAIIGLVWNTVMSFDDGWFFVAASDAISVLKQRLTLPGIGCYMAIRDTALGAYTAPAA